MLLATIPGEVVWPAAAAVGTAMTAMAKAIHVLYVNGRQDSIESISALKDSAHALKDQAAAINKQTEILDRVATYIQEEGRRRASSG